MSLKDSIYCDSLIALFTKEEWYYQSKGTAEFSSSTGLNSTLAHCCISPVTVSQSPTTSSSASYFTTSSLRNCGSKKIVYTQDARKVLNEWLFHVLDEMNLPRELAPTALFYIDRYVNSFSEFKNDLNIVAACALSLAIKYQIGDADARVFTKYLVMISGHEYSFLDTDIYQMELDILDKLNWYVNPPTSQGFLYEFEQIWSNIHIFDDISNNIKETVFQVAKYAEELVQFSLLPCVIVHPPSIIALAALAFAMKDIHDDAIPSLLKKKVISTIFDLGCAFSFRFYKIDLISEIASNIEEYMLSLFSLSYIYKDIDPKGTVYRRDKRLKRSLSDSQIGDISMDMPHKSSKRSL